MSTVIKLTPAASVETLKGKVMKVTIEFDSEKDKETLEMLFCPNQCFRVVQNSTIVEKVVEQTKKPTLTPIYSQNFTVRTGNCFKKMGLKYLEELEYHSEGDLLRQPNLGRKSLNEVKAVLLDKPLKIGSKGCYTYDPIKYANIHWNDRKGAYIKDIQTKLEAEFEEQNND